jgi:nucleosome binding factor SPN SPT16 subunit
MLINLFILLLGKKKSYDIQFYTEAGVQTEDLDFKKRGFGDQDEFEEEQREKAQRKRLNQEFEMFVRAVEGVAKD